MFFNLLHFLDFTYSSHVYLCLIPSSSELQPNSDKRHTRYTSRSRFTRVLVRPIREAASHIQRRVPPGKSKWQPVRHSDKIKE